MRDEQNKLAANVTSLLTIQAANYLIPLALVPFLARVLGIEAFGLFSFAQAFVQYFVLVTEYGFNLSATRQIAASRGGDRLALARIFWSTMVARAILGLLCFTVLVAVVAIVPRLRPDLPVYLAASLAILAGMIVPQWYFQGMECIRSLAVTLLVARLLATVEIFWVVDAPDDVTLVLIIQGIGSLLAGAVTWILISTRLPVAFCRVTLRDLRETFRSGWHVFLSGAAISLYTNSNVFILGLLTSHTEVGYFSVAEKISRAATGFIGPISTAVYPRVANLVSTAPALAFQLLRRVLLALAALGGAVCVILIAVPAPLIHLIAGNGWEAAVPALRWLSVVPLAVAVSSVLGTLTMLNFGLERTFTKVVMYCGLVNVAALMLGSLTLEAEGAAAALALTELAVVAAAAAALQRHDILKDVIPARRRLHKQS